MLNMKYRRRLVFVIGSISLFLYFHIVYFNETVQDAFGYYDGYKSIVWLIELWIGLTCGELYILEDREKLHFYVKQKFRVICSAPVIVYGLYLVSKAGFLWDLVLFELHTIAFMLIAIIALWEERRNRTEQKS